MNANTIANTIISQLSNTYFDINNSNSTINFIQALANTMVTLLEPKTAKYTYVTASAGDGGTATSGSWIKASFNTEEYDNIGITLSNNVLLFPYGKYEIEWFMNFYDTNQCNSRLAIDAGSVLYKYGEIGYADSGTAGNWGGTGHTIVEFSNTANISIEYRVATTKTTTGLGYGPNFGTDNSFRRIFIKKLL